MCASFPSPGYVPADSTNLSALSADKPFLSFQKKRNKISPDPEKVRPPYSTMSNNLQQSAISHAAGFFFFCLYVTLTTFKGNSVS